MMAWISSGSRRSDMAVKPDTSVNITVTCLRSPSMALFDVRIFSARCRGVYAAGEANRSGTLADSGAGVTGPVGAVDPGAAELRRAPHSPQNFWPAGFSCWHAGHCIPRQI